MIFNTKQLTEKLGVRYPIIQAPMAGGATTPALVAAVSNAGGLGSLGAGYMTPADIRVAIKEIRARTNKPFAVNLFIPEAHSATPEQIQKACEDIAQCSGGLAQKIEPALAPYAQPFDDQINVVLQEKVLIFSFAFGSLSAKWIRALKSNNTRLIATATNLLEAEVLEQSGVDLVVVQGCEAGGHRGTFLGKEEASLIELSKLIPLCTAKINIPVIAAGGIMHGKDIMAAIKLGAAGVQMGTAFLTCHESGIHDKYKKTLLAQVQDNTVLTRAFSGKLARGIRNAFTNCMETKKASILAYPIQNALTKRMRQKAKEMDAVEFMSLWAGQAAPDCRAIGAAELVHQLLIEMYAL